MHPRAAKTLWLVIFLVAWFVWQWDGVITAAVALMLLKIYLAGRELATAGPPEDDAAH